MSRKMESRESEIKNLVPSFVACLDHTNSGWTGQSFQVHRETLAIGKKYHDANEALYAAQQANQPPPDLGDVVTRHQRALADFKRLGELGRKLSAIDKEVTSKQAALKPFEYGDSLRDAMLRQEMRQHMRGMTEDQPCFSARLSWPPAQV
jgi:hypothetical protein